MKIPTIRIEEDTESMFRNLIIYEQFFPGLYDRFVCYVKFVDCLISTGKDAELLSECRILDNYYGDDEAAAKIFNSLAYSVLIITCGSYYGDISESE